MKIARVTAAPMSLALGLSIGCSDPPNPPAEAAVNIQITPIAVSCPSVPPFNVPGDAELNLRCNPSAGACDPGKSVVVDRAKGAAVECVVSKEGEGYVITASMSAASMSFTVSGTGITDVGGTATIGESDNRTMTTLADGGCTITVKTIKPGAVWASYNCPGFQKAGDPAGAICTAAGTFLFQNCDK